MLPEHSPGKHEHRSNFSKSDDVIVTMIFVFCYVDNDSAITSKLAFIDTQYVPKMQSRAISETEKETEFT